ncbi:MAG: efflux RND transporter periplasmic adaptor subunit [bacterium]
MVPKIKKIIKRIIITVIILVAAGVGYAKYKQSKQVVVEYTTAKVEREDLKQTVSAAGTIKPLTEVELNFKKTGKIVSILAKKGQQVNEGDVLATQDDASYKIAVQQAQANLTSAIAALNKLKAGDSDEDIEVSEKNVQSAQTAYDNVIKSLETIRNKTVEDIKIYEEAIKSAQTAVNDKNINLNDIKNKYSQNIKNLRDSAITAMSSDIFTATAALDNIDVALSNNGDFTAQQIQTYVSQLNSSYLVSAQRNYNEAIVLIGEMESDIDALQKGVKDDANSALNLSVNAFNKVKQALSLAYSALQNTVVTGDYTKIEIDASKTALVADQTPVEAAVSELQTIQQNLIDAQITYDSQVNSAQASLNTAQDNLNTSKANLSAAEASRDLQISNAEGDIDSKLAALNLSKSQLVLKKAPPRLVDLAAQEAQVEQYRAALALAQEDLDNTVLKSPIAGMTTNINYEIGEQTSVAEPVIVLVTEGNYEIEVDISEADIVKVENGNAVDVTFDSLGEDTVFKAKVIFIDPKETVISDVVYYNVKIAMEPGTNGNFSKVKPGMTANIDIMTDFKPNVLLVPQRAVQSRNGDKYVRILESDGVAQTVKEVDVKLGISGDDGMVEVLSGLEDGQEVVTFTKNGSN